MSAARRSPWVIAAVLFTTMFLIWGPINASGVFFLPVIRHFGWSRAFFSSIVAIAPLSAGLAGVFIGSLLERFGVRKVMITGAAMVALGFLGLSRANSAVAFAALYLMLGAGITASTVIPAAVLITRWFREQRGLALGIVFSGVPLGGTVITMLANYVVLHYGFRMGFVANALPIALVVVPLLAAFLDAPADAEASDGATTGAAADGLEVREAVRTRSFWMIAIAEVMFATAAIGMRVHLVPLLTGVGYAPTVAASLFSAMFVFSAVGTFLAGPLADKFGGRATFAMILLSAALGIASLLGASHLAAVAAFIVLLGLVRETPPALAPIVIGETLGTKQLARLFGIQALFTTFGFALGPIIAGRIFDLTHSYSGALVLFSAMALIASLAIRATLPLAEERARQVPAGEPATA